MYRALILFIFLSGMAPAIAEQTAQQTAQQAEEDWFNAPPDPSAADVNEGQLAFLAQRPAKRVHHLSNTLTISDKTLIDGWADLRQCHQNLDKVPATQIVFRADRIRDLRILSFNGIKEAKVEGSSVQLRDVGEGAKICLTLKTKSLYLQPDGTYHISNGPFMRKFLDGYYPMHVSMEVVLNSKKLRFYDITPAKQTGFSVAVLPHMVEFDAWFEGRLTTLIRFKPS